MAINGELPSATASGIQAGSDTPIPVDSIRQHAERILLSKLFNRSPRLLRFLRFSIEAGLSAQKDRAKEYVVGVEVFDRGPAFDPRIDPVVRVEARRLRARLNQWHETEGSDCSIVVELPVGSYAATFRLRSPHFVHAASAPAPIPALPPRKTIAVLPFTNLNGDVDLEYFSDGLTEELIHSLTRLKDLHVVAWPSALRLKGQQEDIAGARDRLQVETILRGSVRRSGDRLRMTAQLIDAASGHYLWSEAWDRSASDLLAIEQEIAQAIVAKLRVAPQPDYPAPLLPQAGAPESHTLYLKGRFHWNKRTAEGLRLAVACFKQAAEIDPLWPLAWAGLADSYAVLATYNFGAPAPSMLAAREAAQKALTLDPNLSEAITCLAYVRVAHDWQWEDGEALYRRAIDANPSCATAHHWYAVDYLAALGRFDEAYVEIDKAIRLDPLSSVLLYSKALVALVARDYDGAARLYRELLRYDPSFTNVWSGLGRVSIQMGRYAEAVKMFEKARALGDNSTHTLGALGQALALAGQPYKAREILTRFDRLSDPQYVPSAKRALVHLGLGEFSLAVAHLELGADARELSIPWLKVHPAWDALRSHPGFHALLRRIHLA